jgi:hypothetical protein
MMRGITWDFETTDVRDKFATAQGQQARSSRDGILTGAVEAWLPTMASCSCCN